MSYKVIKDFLDVDFITKIETLILDYNFPWRRKPLDGTDTLYFNHCFFNDMNETSPSYREIIIPILNQLDCVSPIQVRTNMFISKLFTKSGWHTDYDLNCKTAILYLNECDGGTELKIDNEIKFIKAEKNKVLIFDSNTLHRAVTSESEPVRYILNFNYFMKGQTEKEKEKN